VKNMVKNTNQKSKVSQWLEIDEPEIRALRNKYFATCLGLLLCSLAFGIFTKTYYSLIAGAAVAAYFLVEALLCTMNKDKYVHVNAVAVSCEDGENVLHQPQKTFRFIPVDDDGEMMDKNGKFDIFITYSGTNKSLKSKNIYIGAVYKLLFFSESPMEDEFSERNLVSIEKAKTQNSADAN
jgi:hypothetical protein